MEVICVPPTAATTRLHMGNLYNWILIDVYKRSGEMCGEKIIAPETWNCYSQKLEERVAAEMLGSTSAKIYEECSRRVDEAITIAKGIFQRYNLQFEGSMIRDDSPEYAEFVMGWIERREKEGNIANRILRQPSLDQIISKSKQIEWLGQEGDWKRFFGLRSPIETISLDRKGGYGIPTGKDTVVGQRIVQFLLPDFHAARYRSIDIGIFGKDVLTKWIYFIIANSEHFPPLKRIGLSGLVLGKDNRKISKYHEALVGISDIGSHPDNVRLGLVKRPFGRDFVQPDFEEEEKLRRKAHHSFIFLRDFVQPNEESELSPITKVQCVREDIAGFIRSLAYSEAYQRFREYIFNELSGETISEIKKRGIKRRELEKLKISLREILNIFMPKTCEGL